MDFLENLYVSILLIHKLSNFDLLILFNVKDLLLQNLNTF